MSIYTDRMLLHEATTVDTPDTGVMAVYVKADGKVYTKDDAGVERTATGGASAVDSVNGQTGVVVLDATDVGAAATGHTHAQSDVTGLVAALSGKANTSHTHAISDVTNLQTSLDAKNATLTAAVNEASGDVTMTNANTFYTGASLSLAAGTYILFAAISCSRANTTATSYTARIRNATDNAVLVSAIQAMPSLNPHYLTITMMHIITIAGTKTINVDAAANQAGCVIRAAAQVNGQGNNATYLNAIKIS